MPRNRQRAITEALAHSQRFGIPRFVLHLGGADYDHVAMPQQRDTITDIVFGNGRVIDVVAKNRPAGL